MDFLNITKNNRNPKQHEFLTSKVPFVLFSGGVGAGKTAAFCWRTIALSVNSPYFGDLSGNVGLIGRLSRTSFDKTTMPELKKWLPKSWIRKFHERDGIIELKNESIIHITHFDQMEHLHGYNIGFCGIDQMEQMPEDVFVDITLERLRLNELIRLDSNGNQIHPAPALPYRTVFGTANPKRGWLYDTFVRNEEYKDSKNPDERKKYDPEYRYINVATYENERFLPEKYVSRQKRVMSDRQYARRVEGHWDAFEGQIYIDFTDDLIVGKKLPEPHWDIYIGIDHGGAAAPGPGNSTNITAVAFLALEPRPHQHPKVHQFDELFLPSSTIKETVEEIERKLMGLATIWRMKHGTDADPYVDNKLAVVKAWRCDPSMKRRNGDNPETIIDTYVRFAKDRGWRMALTAGGNEVDGALEKISWMMREKIYDIGANCKESINELKTYEYGNNDKPAAKQSDHLCDALRYICSALPFWLKKLTHVVEKSREQLHIERIRKQNQFAADEIYGDRYGTYN